MRWDFDALTINGVVDMLVGDIEACGSECVNGVDESENEERFKNQQLYCEVIEGLLDSVYHNTVYAGRPESSVDKIGTYAKTFLGNLVEEYGLNEFTEEKQELIHCKDCKFYDMSFEFCWKMHIEREENDFCSRAKGREE